MSLKVACPNCGKSYNVGSERLGKRAKCICGQIFLIEANSEIESNPVAVSSPQSPESLVPNQGSSPKNGRFSWRRVLEALKNITAMIITMVGKLLGFLKTTASWAAKETQLAWLRRRLGRADEAIGLESFLRSEDLSFQDDRTAIKRFDEEIDRRRSERSVKGESITDRVKSFAHLCKKKFQISRVIGRRTESLRTLGAKIRETQYVNQSGSVEKEVNDVNTILFKINALESQIAALESQIAEIAQKNPLIKNSLLRTFALVMLLIAAFFTAHSITRIKSATDSDISVSSAFAEVSASEPTEVIQKKSNEKSAARDYRNSNDTIKTRSPQSPQNETARTSPVKSETGARTIESRVPEDIRRLIIEAGFGENEDLTRSLEGYVRFGSPKLAGIYAGGDQFDRIELKRQTKPHQDLLYKRRFRLDGLKFTIPERDDVESKGLVADLRLPMRVRGDEPFYKDLKSFTGSLASMHPVELDEGSYAFLTKDTTIIACDPGQAQLVEEKGGLLYHPESKDTSLILIFRGDMGNLKSISRNAEDYSVDIEFTHVAARQPSTWGYYQRRMYLDHDWDCQRVKAFHDVGLDSPKQPVYFTTAFGKQDESKIPEIVSAQVTLLRVVHKGGKVIGGYRLPR